MSENMGRLAVGEARRLALDRFDPDRDLGDWEELADLAERDARLLRSHRAAGRWSSYFTKAARMKSEGVFRLHELLGAQAKVNGGFGTVEAVAAPEGATTAPGEFDVDDAVERIESRLDGTGEPAGSGDGVARRRLEAAANAPAHAGDLREQRNLATWYVTAGYESLFRSSLYAEFEEAAPEPLGDGTLDAVEARLREARDEARDLFRRYYAALASEDWEGLEAHTRRGTWFPFEVRTDLVHLGAALHRARAHHRESDARGSESDAVAVARVEADLHRTTRELTLLLAASYRYLFVARQHDAHEERREAVEAALETGFPSLVRDGLNVDVDDLVAEPGEYDGRFVETEGFVENLRDPSEGGQGTSFDLVDRREDLRLRVFYPYHDLTWWSFRDGAFVHLNGEFAASSEYADGDPELQLDAVNVGGNAGESWLDHVAHAHAGAGVYARYPSQANATWSLELPATNGGER